jgi:hypothetical protein
VALVAADQLAAVVEQGLLGRVLLGVTVLAAVAVAVAGANLALLLVSVVMAHQG